MNKEEMEEPKQPKLRCPHCRKLVDKVLAFGLKYFGGCMREEGKMLVGCPHCKKVIP